MLALAWADRVLWAGALVVVASAIWFAREAVLLWLAKIPGPQPQVPVALSLVKPMTPNAINWVGSWPEGWEREQAEASLRQAMDKAGDWDKAVAMLELDSST